jgi:hypothetical protein
LPLLQGSAIAFLTVPLSRKSSQPAASNEDRISWHHGGNDQDFFAPEPCRMPRNRLARRRITTKLGRRFLQTAHFCDSDGVSTDLGFMQREAVTIGRVR